MRIEHHTIQILSFLINNTTVSIEELAGHLKVSTKTIQRYLLEVENLIRELSFEVALINEGNALKLSGDTNRLKLIIQKLNQLSVDYEKDRVAFIIGTLLNAKQAITIGELSERMHVARSTVEKTVTQAREFIEDYEAEIIGSNRGLVLEASEESKREILASLFQHYLAGMIINTHSAEKLPLNISLNIQTDMMVDKYLIDETQRIINEFVYVNDLDVTDYQYQSVIIHISIAIDRILKERYIEEAEFSQVVDNLLTQQLVKMLESKFNVTIPNHEIAFLNMHVEGFTNNAASHRDGEMIQHLEYSDIIQNAIDKHLQVLKPDEILKQDLAVHLNTSLKRLKQNITIKNPYKEKIKADYSTAFNIAVEIALDISQEAQVIINSDEISYIAIHIQSFLERKDEEKIEVILVCASGYGTVRLLEQRLKQQFGEYIQIKETVGLRELELIDGDNQLIISTIPIESDRDNIITVSPLLTNHDRYLLSNFIEKQALQINELQKLLVSDLVFVSERRNDNRRSVLTNLVTHLIYRGYAKVGLLESALQREEIASTAFHFFALPHGEVEYIEKSVMAVYYNPHGIQWGDQIIKIVFFMAFNPYDDFKVDRFYKEFNELISRQSFLEKLNEIKDREQLFAFLRDDWRD